MLFVCVFTHVGVWVCVIKVQYNWVGGYVWLWVCASLSGYIDCSDEFTLFCSTGATPAPSPLVLPF